MKLVNIVPITYSHLIDNQPMGLFLTHLVERFPTYADFARDFKGYKILDNSLIELGGAVSMSRILKAATDIQADEIILPDVFQDGPGTLEVVHQTIEERYFDIKNYSIMAVCQGKNLKEFTDCFYELSSIPQIQTIGIPKISKDLHPLGRAGLEFLWQNSYQCCTKQIHLLGLQHSFAELNAFRFPEDIRSVDSCLAAYFSVFYNRTFEPFAIRPDKQTIELDDLCIHVDKDMYFKYVNYFTDDRGNFSWPLIP